jgi:hypothetical protein
MKKGALNMVAKNGNVFKWDYFSFEKVRLTEKADCWTKHKE